MAEIEKGVYNRRHPERTDYYRIIENNFDEFERKYSDMFEEKYGYLRKESIKAIYAFLDCGIPENGIARIKCKKCGDDYFVSFSCHERVVCPSCSTKRSLLFGEKIKEIVKPVSHIHATFTIPKILRVYFKRNRKLLKLLAQSTNYAINKYFTESLKIKDGYTGGIYYIQSQGSLFNYHPHVHAIVIAGIINEEIFYEQTNMSFEIITEIFRRKLLTELLKAEVITQEFVNMLLTWNHSSGFNVHGKEIIDSGNTEVIENVARYMSRAAISTDRVKFNPDDNTVIVYEKQDRLDCKSKAYNILEFMAQITSHIPSPYESLVYYYGIYSSSHRGKEKRENIENQKIEVKEVTSKKGIAGGKITSTWARLIKRIFEVDPLCCKKCGGEMKIIAFITNSSEIKKILKYIHEETVKPSPIKPILPAYNDNSEFKDYQPSNDDYMRDPEYVNSDSKFKIKKY